MEGDNTFKLGKCGAYDGAGFYAREKAHTVTHMSSIMFFKDGVDQTETGILRPGSFDDILND